MSISTQSELTAIRESAGIFPLDDRAFLRITGEDATRWLNGMVTNSIQSLAPGEGNYNFLLNAQGRIQGDCTIYREPGDEPTFLLETDAAQLNTIQQLLDKFIIMDDVEMTRGLQIIGQEARGMAVLGEKAPRLIHKVLSAINEEDVPQPLPTPKPGTMIHALSSGVLVIVLTPPASGTSSHELWFESEKELQHARKLMESDGAVDLSNEAQEAHRILSGTPRFGQDIRDRDLPQETNQTHALHFTKGCYLGQEIVERIHSRGQVHRTFTGFRLSALPATLPAPLTSNGKPAGDITSATTIDGQTYALGYARREALLQSEAHNIPLEYEGGTATPSPLPFPTS
jgi:folate-binding protein YgfZ